MIASNSFKALASRTSSNVSTTVMMTWSTAVNTQTAVATTVMIVKSIMTCTVMTVTEVGAERNQRYDSLYIV